MNFTEQWIWLPNDLYKDSQTTVFGAFSDINDRNYTVAEFKRDYVFPQKAAKVILRFCADTVFQLFCNGKLIATGPACVGGDFIGNDTVRDNFYAFEETLILNSNELCFFARVQMSPYHICEYSKGHGGFMLSACVIFDDGSEAVFCTDESWLVRKNGAYNAPRSFNGNISPDEFVSAQVIENVWNTVTAPIPVREESVFNPKNSTVSLAPFEEKTVILELDKIWAGFISVETESEGEVQVKATCRELTEQTEPESLIFFKNQSYRGFSMHSASNIEVVFLNRSSAPATVKVSFIKTHYPIFDEASTVTSDAALNVVLDVCKHTLKICRQTHHLDSPRHCEPMACTGDYYIESLMTAFSFGDMRLAEFDLVRTAVMLERENGRMFHTTYSLIWVRMLYDVYLFTGNMDLLKSCEKALSLLLARFDSYFGDNGLIESPPDYMFIDWLYIDGVSLHHPPKALGQTCLNMFCFGALKSAADIYSTLGNTTDADACLKKSEALRRAINTLLFDSDKGCYFEGLNTPTDPQLIGMWMPQNVSKRYYLKHSNILAAYFGVCDNSTARSLIDKIVSDEIQGDIQPYFMHYLLEAIYLTGYREKYTLQICERWKSPVLNCKKGLVEGFVPPEPTYSFDHSHAWGGTPLYSLPKALMGLRIVEAGMRRIELSPALLGLDHATVELLTPYGKVVCRQEKGKAPQITHPDEVEIILRTT